MPRSLLRVAAVAAAIAVAQAVLALWFAWPAQHLAPRDLPVVVAGPAPATTAFADRLRAERPGAFDVRTVPDAAAVDDALRDRTAYAGFVLAPDGPSLHVASAASPAVAALLTQAAQDLGGGRPVRVVDVVAAPADDPRGTGFAAGFLPLLLASLAAGVAVALVTATRTARLVGLSVFALAAGLLAPAVLHWSGVLAGSYPAEAGAVGLFTLAVAGTVAGLGAVLGRTGIGLAVGVVFLLANPISGLAAAPELLPQPWGAVGQFLPPGAGASLLRSVAYFDGAGAAMPLGVLAAWAGVGLVLLLAGRQPVGVASGEPTGARGRELAPA